MPPARSGRANIQKGLLPLNDTWLLHTSTLQFCFCTAYLHFMQGKVKRHLSIIPTESRTPNTLSPKKSVYYALSGSVWYQVIISFCNDLLENWCETHTGMKQLALFLLHFFWLCYTMKEKQTHSKSRHSQAPHLQSVVELFRSPDSILYLFKHGCFYIYMKTLVNKGTKPSPDSTLEGILKFRFFARKHQRGCVLSFALYWTKL